MLQTIIVMFRVSTERGGCFISKHNLELHYSFMLFSNSFDETTAFVSGIEMCLREAILRGESTFTNNPL